MVAKRLTQLFLPLMMFLLLGFGAVSPAHAAPEYLTVNVAASGDGVVAINNYNYGNYAWDTIGYNDTVNLTAMPNQYSTFAGWWDNNHNYMYSYQNDIWITTTEDINFTALFEPEQYVLAVDLTPTYGGKVYCGAVADMWVTGIDTSLPHGYYALDVYAESDYTFMGWYDDSYGFVSGNVPYYFDLTGDTYLHAEFQKVPDPLYFVFLDIDDPSGGWVYGHLNSNNYGGWINVEAVPAAGYVFAGWTETGSGMPVSPDASYTFQIYSDQYYTAHFKPANAPCTIVTLPGEGSGIMPDYTVADGETFYLPECTFIAPPGKEFDEWNVGAPGTGIVMHSDMTITAMWKDISGYTVHIEPNGGTGYMPDPIIAPGAQYELPECTFTGPGGQVFDTWDVGAPGEKITVNSETWIYAQWKDPVVNHLVYIDPNGGGGFMLDPYVEHGKEYTLPANEFSAPAGMEFGGWDVGKPGDKITVNADMSIYAQWVPEGTAAAAAAAAASASSASPDPSSSSAASASASSESASASASSTSASSTSASGSGSSSSASGSSTNSGTNQGGNELPILPIAGGVAGGAVIAGLIAFLVTRRKKEEQQPLSTQATQPIEQPAPQADHAQHDEGFED